MADGIPPTALLEPGVIDDPYAFYDRLRAEAPVWNVADTGVCTVTSFDLVAEATGRVEDFSSRMYHLLYCGDDGLPARLPFGDGNQVLTVADPPVHTAHRKAVFPDLMNRRMTSLQPEVDDVVRRCLDAAVSGEPVDYMAAVANVVPITMITTLMGFRDPDLAMLLRAAFDSTAIVGVRHSFEELQDLLARSADTYAWIAGQFDAHGDAGEGNLMGTIARGIDDGALTVDDGVVILLNLLSAGGESTTSLLGNAVRILAELPDLQARLRAEPDLLPAFIEDALRVESPFRFLMRHTPHDTTLGGVDIPSGTTVLLFWGAANRDPAEYDHPAEVRLDRPTPRHHLAFGRGIHLCVGAPLARLEATSVLTALLDRTSHISLVPGDPPQWFDSLQVRRHARLPVVLEPR